MITARRGRGKRTLSVERFRGVWSATPTPFTDSYKVDKPCVRRLVEHHLRLGVQGLFVCGTCGEGPWMTNAQRATVIRTVCEASAGRLLVAAQVTDNSAGRIVDNMKMVADEGADIAVIAPPSFLVNATDANVVRLYLDAADRSPLPVGIYDRGNRGDVPVSNAVLKRIYAHEKVVLAKDSSMEPARMRIALAERRRRAGLALLNGFEFDCVAYLKAGYDGLLLGGGIFNGRLAGMLIEAVAAGDLDAAGQLQKRMNRLMWDVYGGKRVGCWQSGMKELLVRLKVFRTHRNLLGYELTDACSRAIDRAIAREREVLLPCPSVNTRG